MIKFQKAGIQGTAKDKFIKRRIDRCSSVLRYVHAFALGYAICLMLTLVCVISVEAKVSIYCPQLETIVTRSAPTGFDLALRPAIPGHTLPTHTSVQAGDLDPTIR